MTSVVKNTLFSIANTVSNFCQERVAFRKLLLTKYLGWKIRGKYTRLSFVIEAGLGNGTRDPLLQYGNTLRGQQNTKKLQEIKSNCMHVSWGKF